MTELNIGVLSIQGDVSENVSSTQDALKEFGEKGTVSTVKTPEQIAKVDGLIIPGGESTMIGQLSLVNGSLKKIKEKIEEGMPVLGICAGLILLSKDAKDRVIGEIDQPLLDLLDVQVERNSFGRQKDSFETEIAMDSINIPKFNGIFIRAPSIIEVGEKVEIISKFNEKIVAVKQDNMLGTAFHPELSSDISIHRYFVNMIKQAKRD
ncbi:MAG: pyridoxal 5'-phosphate synthase glutaminase subunit PdxT [Thaumarchaeota archaeon]|nr:pyridoxal 5'-phosphate synthase glutaminase subunit PdxT [Nitrososphaerota archaeon]